MTKGKQPHADILPSCFKQMVMENSFHSDFQWVVSHQDDEKKWKNCTVKEHINVLMDDLAKETLVEVIASRRYIDNRLPF